MTTIEEDYVSFETSKLLKEKGFNEKLLTFYITDEAKKEGYFQLMAFTDDKIDNNHSDYCYLAPTLQMAMKWLREIHNIGIFPSTYTHIVDRKTTHSYGTAIISLKTYELMIDNYLSNDTYEGAVEAAIKYCLENLI